MQSIRSAMAEMIRQCGMSIRTIAIRANIPEATIRNIVHGRSEDPRLSTVAAICTACGYTIEQLFRMAYGDPQAEPKPPEDDLIAAMEHLQRVISARAKQEGDAT
jgi:transcriptional regulator with XRE-family HTH domain